MKTVGGREMTAKEKLFVEMCSLFYKEGMSVNEMIQGAYEAQRHVKRDNNQPVQTNTTEKVR